MAVVASNLEPKDFSKALASRAKAVIKNHIRNAVLIDDDWPSLEEKNQLVVTASLEQEQEVEDDQSISGEDEIELEVHSFPQTAKRDVADDQARLLRIQESFVKNGIICTGLKYTAADKSIAPKLAKNADIIILDWNFGADGGEGAIEILQSLRDRQLRFVCVFTDQQDLDSIKKALWEKVCEMPASDELQSHFKAKNFVFTIRNKAVPKLESDVISKEDDLLENAVEHLALHYSGLLQLGMLELTARHRDHLLTHLTKYSPDFDAALLSEYVQKHSPVNVVENLRALLIDEWRSTLLEQSAQTSDMETLAKTAMSEFAGSLSYKVEALTPPFLFNCLTAAGLTPKIDAVTRELGTQQEPGRLAKSMKSWLENGASSPAPNLDGGHWKKDDLPKATIAYLFALCRTDKQDQIPTRETIYGDVFRLDALFNQQLILPPSIGQGTILKDEQENYFICVTPLCDTARLPDNEPSNAYTFLGAVAVPAGESLEKYPNYCVFMEGDKAKCLHVDIKSPYTFEIAKTAAEDILIGKVVPVSPRTPKIRSQAARSGDGEPVEPAPVSLIIANLKVVGQLRTDFFLMLSAAAAGNASRVGVNRVEFIRAHKSR